MTLYTGVTMRKREGKNEKDWGGKRERTKKRGKGKER